MTLAEKLTKVAENVSKVFQAGKKSQYDEFWDNFQQNGNRKIYISCFGSGWTAETLKPKYTIKPTNANMMFYSNVGESLILEDARNFPLDFSECTNANYGIARLHSTIFGTLNFEKCTNTQNLFYSHDNANHGVRTIEEFKSSEKTVFNANTFQNATFLTNINMTGTVASNIDFSKCTLLTNASIGSVVLALKQNFSGKTATFSDAAVTNAFDEEEWRYLTDTRPSWTISRV